MLKGRTIDQGSGVLDKLQAAAAEGIEVPWMMEEASPF